MTGRPRRVNGYQQRVAIAIIIEIFHFLRIAAGSTLVPQLLSAATPEPGFALFQSQTQALFAHPSHHQNLMAGAILNNRRNQARFVKF